MREPLIEAALAGERKFFAADFEHPTRGPLAVQTEYIPWVDADGRGARAHHRSSRTSPSSASPSGRCARARSGSGGSPIRRRR